MGDAEDKLKRLLDSKGSSLEATVQDSENKLKWLLYRVEAEVQTLSDLSPISSEVISNPYGSDKDWWVSFSRNRLSFRCGYIWSNSEDLIQAWIKPEDGHPDRDRFYEKIETLAQIYPIVTDSRFINRKSDPDWPGEVCISTLYEESFVYVLTSILRSLPFGEVPFPG